MIIKIPNQIPSTDYFRLTMAPELVMVPNPFVTDKEHKTLTFKASKEFEGGKKTKKKLFNEQFKDLLPIVINDMIKDSKQKTKQSEVNRIANSYSDFYSAIKNFSWSSIGTLPNSTHNLQVLVKFSDIYQKSYREVLDLFMEERKKSIT